MIITCIREIEQMPAPALPVAGLLIN